MYKKVNLNPYIFIYFNAVFPNLSVILIDPLKIIHILHTKCSMFLTNYSFVLTLLEYAKRTNACPAIISNY